MTTGDARPATSADLYRAWQDGDVDERAALRALCAGLDQATARTSGEWPDV